MPPLIVTGDGPIDLTHEGSIRYSGLRYDGGLAHYRIYEGPDRRPVAVVGQLDDNPGTPIKAVIEQIAEALPMENHEFELVTYAPGDSEPYMHATFTVRKPGELSPADEEAADAALGINWQQEYGDYELLRERGLKYCVLREPVWHPLEDVKAFLDVTYIEEWNEGEYTCAAVLGDEGEKARVSQIRNNDAMKMGLYESEGYPPLQR